MSGALAQVSAQLDSVLARDSSVRAVAIRTPVNTDWPSVLERRGIRFHVRWCDSRLALREALQIVCSDHQDGVLLLTSLADHEIPDDVMARLARTRVFQPKGWEIVRQMFNTHSMDARLGRYDWMPQVLMDALDQSSYAPVPSGFLDLDSAWREVLGRVLKMDSARPDAVSLMKWTQRQDADVSLGLLPPVARTDTLKWLASCAGGAGELITSCIEAGRTADALPLALVCGVIFSTEAEGVTELAQAAIRMERYLADHHVSVARGREWSEYASRHLEASTVDEMRGALDRANAILAELRAASFAHLSDWLPSGLELRLKRFGEALGVHVAAPSKESAAQVDEAAAAVTRHRLASTQVLRIERVKMARRLANWMLYPVPADGSFDALVAYQADDGSFVDWARFRLLGGDELPELSDAYAALRAAVTNRKTCFVKKFATTLAERSRDAVFKAARAVPVESILDTVVAPIAASQPVLLLVIDGLSLSIFRELFQRPESLGWCELIEEGASRPLAGLAAIPTITEISRTSLLCGRLMTGAAPQEKHAFAACSALLAHSTASLPPRLFHKADLTEDGNLAQEVRLALANKSQRVVGVVYNAVDDHLSGPDQLHQRWSLESLRLMAPLLREARDAGRVLVVTADHGHLLEDGSQLVSGGSSDRWRPGSVVSDANEIKVSGSRVLTNLGAQEVVCLWSETARYTGRKNGYHGGVSPQEVIVPLSIFAPFGVNVAGRTLAPPQQPEWWELIAPLELAVAVPAAAMPRKSVRKSSEVSTPQEGLFAPEDLPIPYSKEAPQNTDWVADLFASTTYASQRQLAARVALPDAQMRRLLESLAERGGKLSRTALAQRLGVPELRLGGLLSAARRTLNADQSAVLSVDEAAGSIELNRTLLVQQFRLSPHGEAK